jgi:hypothetical protein
MEAIKVFSNDDILKGPNPFAVIYIEKFVSETNRGFSRVEAIKKLINKEEWVRNLHQIHVMVYPGKYARREEFDLFTDDEIDSVSVSSTKGHDHDNTDMILGICMVDTITTKRVIRINALDIFLPGHNFEGLMYKLIYNFYKSQSKISKYMIPINPPNIKLWKILELNHFHKKHLQRLITNTGFEKFCEEFLWSKDDLLEYLNSNKSNNSNDLNNGNIQQKQKRKYTRRKPIEKKVVEVRKKRKYVRRSLDEQKKTKIEAQEKEKEESENEKDYMEKEEEEEESVGEEEEGEESVEEEEEEEGEEEVEEEEEEEEEEGEEEVEEEEEEEEEGEEEGEEEESVEEGQIIEGDNLNEMDMDDFDKLDIDCIGDFTEDDSDWFSNDF